MSRRREVGRWCPSCSSFLLPKHFLSLLQDTYSSDSHITGLFHPLLLNIAVMLRPLSHSVPFLIQGHSLNTNPALILANLTYTEMFMPASTTLSPKQARTLRLIPLILYLSGLVLENALLKKF